MKTPLLTALLAVLFSLSASSQPWGEPNVDSVYYFKSDTLVTNWQLDYAEVFSHNAYGEGTFYGYKEWDGSNWIFWDKYFYAYDANHNWNYEFNKYYNDTIWVDNYQLLLTYDANNNKTSEIKQLWNGSAWYDYQRASSTYDANNNKTSEMKQIWNGSVWYNYQGGSATYDTSNNLLSDVGEEWDSAGNVVATVQVLYTYDANNNQTSYEYQYYRVGDYPLRWLYQYAYDANNNKTYQLQQNWNLIDSAYENATQGTFIYDANQNMIENISQNWDDTVWTNGYKDSYTYNANHNKTSRIVQHWTAGSWVNNYYSTYTYNANNQQTLQVWFWWNDTVWVPDGQYRSGFDANNREISGVRLVATINGLMPIDSLYSYYSTPGTCSALFNLYPDTAVLHHYFINNLATGTGPLSYVWDWGDGTTDTTAYPSHTYASAGFYAICLTIRDANGCSANNCSNFTLQRNTNAMVYVEVLQPASTGIAKQAASLSFSIFPNPASGYFTVIANEQGPAQLEIFNALGDKVFQTTINRSMQTVNTNLLSPGVYMVRVSSGKKHSVQRLVVR